MLLPTSSSCNSVIVVQFCNHFTYHTLYFFLPFLHFKCSIAGNVVRVSFPFLFFFPLRRNMAVINKVWLSSYEISFPLRGSAVHYWVFSILKVFLTYITWTVLTPLCLYGGKYIKIVGGENKQHLPPIIYQN